MTYPHARIEELKRLVETSGKVLADPTASADAKAAAEEAYSRAHADLLAIKDEWEGGT